MGENNNNNLKIKDWALEDRPREKLLAKGLNSLSDAELVAILIGAGNRTETAVGLAKKMLAKVDNNLNEFGKLSINDLTDMNGIGKAKAISIIAAMELGRRRKLAEFVVKKKMDREYNILKSFPVTVFFL